MDDQTKAAFAAATDCAKQLVTLSTAILALEVTFATNILETPGGAAKGLLAVSWVLLLLSLLAGIWTMLALTGSLGSAVRPTPGAINDVNVRYPAIAQVILFLLGLAFTVLFGMMAL